MTRRHLFTFILFFFTCCLPGLAQQRLGQPAAGTGKPLRILFIGNSYVFVNNLPEMVKGMAMDRRHPVEVKSVSFGAYTLGAHWQDGEKPGKARGELANGNWDYVVLQDQSEMPAIVPEQTLKPAALFAEAIKKKGAIPIFYITPAHYTKPKAMAEFQDKLTSTYAQAAKDGGGRLAPVGPAFMLSYRQQPGLRLHSQDNSHFNIYGTYLAACVIYSTITGEPANGLIALRGSDPKTTVWVQKIANEAVKAAPALMDGKKTPAAATAKDK
jgi:hypothetical protein